MSLLGCGSASASDGSDVTDTGFSGEESAPYPGPVAYPAPDDMSSNVGLDVLPAISLSERADSIADAAARGGLSLVTWPELADVSTTIELVDSTASSVYSGYRLRPAAPLTDRWYALRLSLPAGGMTVNPSWFLASGGSHVARFRPGSDPAIAAIAACTKGGSSYKMMIRASEALAPIDSATLANIAVRQSGTNPGCSAFASEGGDRQSMSALCSSFDVTARTDVTIPVGLRAQASDKSVAAGTISFTPSSGADVGGCREWRAP